MSKSTLNLDEMSVTAVQEKISTLRPLLSQPELFDDAALKRFLIARQYDIQKTKDMLENYIVWRKDNKIADIQVPDGKTVPFLMSLRKLDNFPDVNYDVNAPGVRDEFKKFYPHQGGGGIHGYDKQGQPLYIERLGHYNVKKLAETCPADVFAHYSILNDEFMFGAIMKDASERKGELVEKNTVIFDCSGMGIHQFHIPGLMLLKVLAELNSAIYPERLGRLFVINAPIFFSAAWAIVKVWLDKRILDKIFILGSDYKSVLLKHISHDNLPSFLGGSCTCAHMDGGCVPTRNETSKGDPNGYRHTAVLKKNSEVHVHELVIEKKASIQYGYSSNTKVTFVIKEGQKSLYKQEGSKSAGSFPVKPGRYTIEWNSTTVSTFKSCKLDYNLHYVTEEADKDSGFDMREVASLCQSLEEDIFYDAAEYL